MAAPIRAGKAALANVRLRPRAESFIAGTASCRIQVAGGEELYAVLKPKGVVHPSGTLENEPWGDREFAVSDPDRNLVTFFEPLDGGN